MKMISCPHCMALLSLILAIIGCDSQQESPKQLSQNDLNQRLLKIANEYKTYSLVDETRLRWSPLKCTAPPPPAVSVSTSEDFGTHGRKLYLLFASQLQPYAKSKERENPVGQVLVKENWTPVEVEEIEFEEIDIEIQGVKYPPYRRLKTFKHKSGRSVHPYATLDGKTFRTGAQNTLFIMYKIDPSTPGTDSGWVYGAVSPDGKEVIAAGRIESCMNCHKEAGKDRLFGLRDVAR